VVDIYRGKEGDGIIRHLLHGVGCCPGRTPYSCIIEGYDPARRRQRVNQRGIPVVEIPAEMLEQDQRHRPFAGLAVRIVDAVRGADQHVREF
jgi:hypothetical protein